MKSAIDCSPGPGTAPRSGLGESSRTKACVRVTTGSDTVSVGHSSEIRLDAVFDCAVLFYKRNPRNSSSAGESHWTFEYESDKCRTSATTHGRGRPESDAAVCLLDTEFLSEIRSVAACALSGLISKTSESFLRSSSGRLTTRHHIAVIASFSVRFPCVKCRQINHAFQIKRDQLKSNMPA